MSFETQRRFSPHVLVVSESFSLLKDTCARLLCDRYEVSSCHSVACLHDAVSRLQPDLVLLDVLATGFSAERLVALLSEYPAGGSPSVLLLSRILPSLLKNLVDTRDALGIVQATKSDLEFSLAFSGILERTPGLAVRSHSSVFPAVSGTHLVSRQSSSSIRTRIAGARTIR